MKPICKKCEVNIAVAYRDDLCDECFIQTHHKVCSHILWLFGLGGYQPGGFMEALLNAWTKADGANNARLSLVYPTYAKTIGLANEPGGRELMKLILEGEAA